MSRILLSTDEMTHLMELSGGRALCMDFGPGWCSLQQIEQNLWAGEALYEYRKARIKQQQHLKEGAFLA